MEEDLMFNVLKITFIILLIVISFEIGFFVHSYYSSSSSDNQKQNPIIQNPVPNKLADLESKYVTQSNKGIISKISEITNVANKKVITNAQLHVIYKGQVNSINLNDTSISSEDESMYMLQIVNPENQEKDYPIAISRKDLPSVKILFKEDQNDQPVRINADDLEKYVRIGDTIEVDNIQDIDKSVPSYYTITKVQSP